MGIIAGKVNKAGSPVDKKGAVGFCTLATESSMTEDRVQDGDELNFDDEEFIIEDLGDDDEDIFAEADLQMNPASKQPGEGSVKQSQEDDLLDVADDYDDFVIEEENSGETPATDLDDILFEAISERSVTSEFDANLGEDFSESEQRETGEIEQYNLPETLGFEGNADEGLAEQVAEEDDELFAIEDEDIELIDGDMEPATLDGDQESIEVAESPTGFSRYGGSDEQFAEDESPLDGELVAASLDDPESFAIEAGDDDPIYGAEESGASEDQAGQEEQGWQGEETDYSDFEDEYIDDQAEQEAQLLGGGHGRRFPFRAAAGLAATLMVVAAGAVVFLKPEWIGLKIEIPAIEVVKIARPNVDGGLELPQVPVVASSDPAPVNPPPVIDDPPVVNPAPVFPPVVIEPPEIVDPVVPINVIPIRPVLPVELNNALPQLGGPLQVGEFLSIDQAEELAVIEPRVSGKRINLSALLPGSQAFAQLPNEAYFVGTVRKLNVSHVTLTLNRGEVTLAYEDLISLTTLAEAGIALNGNTDAQHGYVRLENQNRLYGMVIQSEGSEHVLLESENSKVRIPEDSIDKIGVAIKGGVEILDLGDDEWMEDQVRARMRRNRGQAQRFQPGVNLPKPGKK